MGVSLASPPRSSGARSTGLIAAGITAWLCAAVVLALAAFMVTALVHQGYSDAVRTGGAEYVDVARSFGWSLTLVATALPIATILALFAGIAAAEPAIGGRMGRVLNFALRAGPSIPSVGIGTAALVVSTVDLRIQAQVVSHPLGAPAVALAALNLPIMTARFRTVIRAVPLAWRVAATAAGATPAGAFLRVCFPRASTGILSVVIAGLGQMLGETVVVAIVLTCAHAPTPPLSILIWQQLVAHGPSASAPLSLAFETLVLVFAIVALRATARLMARRRRPLGARP